MKALKILILGFLLMSATVKAQPTSFVPNELLVQFSKQALSEQAPTQLIQSLNLSITKLEVLSKSLGIYCIQFKDESYREMAQNRLLSSPIIQFAQVNHTGIQKRAVPNDPNYVTQWAAEVLKLEQAWSITTGGVTLSDDTIVLAVIDGGIDMNHDELELFKNRAEIDSNGIDDDGNGYLDDVYGWNAYTNNATLDNDFHGTHVAGILGAKGNNEQGIAGINWNVKILPVMGASGIESTVIKAYDYVYQMRKLYNETNGEKGAFIVAANSSFGINARFENEYPLWCSFYDSLGAVGVLSVSAVANSSVNVDTVGDIPTLCSSPYLLTVTNSNEDDELAFNAAFGTTYVDVAAPGENIYSTAPFDGYDFDSGTSFAAPHVTGAVGLLYSTSCAAFNSLYELEPDSAALLVKRIILEEGMDKIPAFAGKIKSEGRLNIGKAVTFMDACKLNSVSIREYEKPTQSVLVYPNPATDILTIASRIQVGILYLTDANGRLVFSSPVTENVQLNLVDLGFTEGVYYGTIVTEKSIENFNFIKLKQP